MVTEVTAVQGALGSPSPKITIPDVTKRDAMAIAPEIIAANWKPKSIPKAGEGFDGGIAADLDEGTPETQAVSCLAKPLRALGDHTAQFGGHRGHAPKVVWTSFMRRKVDGPRGPLPWPDS
jgi:hypothetical protein